LTDLRAQKIMGTVVSRSLFALLATLSAGSACAASDWRYAGTLRDGPGEVPQFFDAQSIGHPTKDIMRVWVKAIRARDLESYYNAHEKWVTDETTRKISTGYVPDFLMLPLAKAAFANQNSRSLPGGIPTTFNEAVVELTKDEVMANALDVHAVSKLFVEIDCTGKRFKVLNPSLFGDGSDTASKGTRSRGDYQFIPLGTGPDWLSLLVCPST
jgi:hypothetical protein